MTNEELRKLCEEAVRLADDLEMLRTINCRIDREPRSTVDLEQRLIAHAGTHYATIARALLARMERDA